MVVNTDNKIRIIGTLKHGAVLEESRKQIIILYVVFCVIFLIGIIWGAYVISIEQHNNPDNILSFVFCLLSLILGLSSIPIIWLIIIVRNEKIRNEIKEWLKDAVKLTAYSKQIEVSKFFIPSVKIQVTFKYEELNYSFLSEGRMLGGGTKEGFHRIWSDYANREIEILFSPTYKQVMIIKD